MTSLKTRSGSALRGIAALPGDKSISHRAILFAAMADGDSVIDNLLVSGVTRAMLAALRALGVRWQLDGHRLQVQGQGWSAWQPPAGPIDCGNSATTLRLLAGALAASGVAAVLDGSPGLRRRPMSRIVRPLQQMGVAVSATEGCAPLTMSARQQPLLPMQYTLPVASAQVKSCLLLAALAAAGETTLIEPGPSRDHTERMLQKMGVEVTTAAADLPGANQARQVTLTPPTAPLRPLDLIVPGDVSAAAFLIVAALITPGTVMTLTSVGLNPTRTGLLDALRRMGAEIAVSNQTHVGGEPVADLTVRASELQGTVIGGDLVVRMIDEFPVLAIAAALAEGRTVVRDAVELRHKESDRISALCRELAAVGANVTETADGFIIEGQPLLRGGTIDPHGDHRLAMSLAVAGLRSAAGVTVKDAEIIQESFPEFATVLEQLGATIQTSN